MGVGSIAAKALEGAATATRSAAATRAAQRTAAGTRSARRDVGRRLGQDQLTRGQRRAAREELAELKARPAQAAAAVRNRPMPTPTRTAALRYGGELDNAVHAQDLARTVESFPELAGMARSGSTALRVAQGSFAAGTAADLGSLAAGESKLFPDKPFPQEFEDVEDEWDPLR